MSVIVTDTGFSTDDWTGKFVPLHEVFDTPGAGLGVDVPSDGSVAVLKDRIADLALVRIDFPSYSDGRGFTLATELRQLGYAGRLRARGHVISDQYAMARRVGFDEVEIDESIAARQPEDQWLFRANWREFNHQARLRG